MRNEIRSPHEKNLVLSILLIVLLAGYMTMICKLDEGLEIEIRGESVDYLSLELEV